MPIYTYECPTCGHHFDEIKKLSDRDSEVRCPKCTEQAKRVLAGFAVGRGGGGAGSLSASVSRSSTCGVGGA